MPDETTTPDPLALCGAITEQLAEYATEGPADLAGRFAVYAMSIDGYESLGDEAQAVCRDFATWVLRERAAVTRLLQSAAALTAAHEQGRKDSIRLDWLERYGSVEGYGLGEVEVDARYVDKGLVSIRLQRGGCPAYTGSDLRAAIDTARAGEANDHG